MKEFFEACSPEQTLQILDAHVGGGGVNGGTTTLVLFEVGADHFGFSDILNMHILYADVGAISFAQITEEISKCVLARSREEGR